MLVADDSDNFLQVVQGGFIHSGRVIFVIQDWVVIQLRPDGCPLPESLGRLPVSKDAKVEALYPTHGPVGVPGRVAVGTVANPSKKRFHPLLDGVSVRLFHECRVSAPEVHDGPVRLWGHVLTNGAIEDEASELRPLAGKVACQLQYIFFGWLAHLSSYCPNRRADEAGQHSGPLDSLTRRRLDGGIFVLPRFPAPAGFLLCLQQAVVHVAARPGELEVVEFAATRLA